MEGGGHAGSGATGTQAAGGSTATAAAGVNVGGVAVPGEPQTKAEHEGVLVEAAVVVVVVVVAVLAVAVAGVRAARGAADAGKDLGAVCAYEVGTTRHHARLNRLARAQTTRLGRRERRAGRRAGTEHELAESTPREWEIDAKIMSRTAQQIVNNSK